MLNFRDQQVGLATFNNGLTPNMKNNLFNTISEQRESVARLSEPSARRTRGKFQANMQTTSPVNNQKQQQQY